MLYTQANEICTHEEKNTIIADHVIKALEQLELQDWIEPVEQALAEFKDASKGNKPGPVHAFAVVTISCVTAEDVWVMPSPAKASSKTSTDITTVMQPVETTSQPCRHKKWCALSQHFHLGCLCKVQ